MLGGGEGCGAIGREKYGKCCRENAGFSEYADNGSQLFILSGSGEACFFSGSRKSLRVGRGCLSNASFSKKTLRISSIIPSSSFHRKANTGSGDVFSAFSVEDFTVEFDSEGGMAVDCNGWGCLKYIFRSFGSGF